MPSYLCGKKKLVNSINLITSLSTSLVDSYKTQTDICMALMHGHVIHIIMSSNGSVSFSWQYFGSPQYSVNTVGHEPLLQLMGREVEGAEQEVGACSS